MKQLVQPQLVAYRERERDEVCWAQLASVIEPPRFLHCVVNELQMQDLQIQAANVINHHHDAFSWGFSRLEPSRGAHRSNSIRFNAFLVRFVPFFRSESFPAAHTS